MMNPTDMIFQAISQMTGGLIADLSTAMIGMVMLSFIFIGFDLLMDVLGGHVQTMVNRKKLTGRLTVPRVDQKLEMESKPEVMDVYHKPYYKRISFWGNIRITDRDGDSFNTYRD